MNLLKDTYSPFGLEKNGNSYYFKCILNNYDLNNNYIKKIF